MIESVFNKIKIINRMFFYVIKAIEQEDDWSVKDIKFFLEEMNVLSLELEEVLQSKINLEN